MKALEILKDYLKNIELYEISYEEHEYEDEDYLKAKVQSKKVYEAIKELEELENRSCDTCKWLGLDGRSQCTLPSCQLYGYPMLRTYETYCNRWENKHKISTK